MGPEGPVLQKEVSLFLHQEKLGLETKHGHFFGDAIGTAE
jgi:hypothetical protein